MTLEKDKPAPPKTSPSPPTFDELLTNYRQLQQEKTPPRRPDTLNLKLNTLQTAKSNEASPDEVQSLVPATNPEGAQSGDAKQQTHVPVEQPRQCEASPVAIGPPISPESSVAPPKNLLGPVAGPPKAASRENDDGSREQSPEAPETDAQTVDNPPVIYGNPAFENSPGSGVDLPEEERPVRSINWISTIADWLRNRYTNDWEEASASRFWTGIGILCVSVTMIMTIAYLEFSSYSVRYKILTDPVLHPELRNQSWGHD